MRLRKAFLTGAIAVSAFLGVCHADVHASRYTVYVNRKTNIVNVVNSKNGKLARSMWCSTGKRYGTIRGTFHTTAKYRWRALFGGVFGQYSVRIHGHYLFHSVPYTSTRKDRVDVADYNRLGKQDSQGCVRMAVVDEKWLYDHCATGTKVVIGELRKLKKPTRPLLRLSTDKKTSWDPTDPDPDNPYRVRLAWKEGVSRTVERGSDFDISSYLYVKSSFTKKKVLLKNVSYTGEIDTEVPGRYRLRVTVKDPNTLLSRTRNFTFTVK